MTAPAREIEPRRVRLRVDPSRIRVGIRPTPRGWVCRIESRQPPDGIARGVEVFSPQGLVAAVDRALELAEFHLIAGLDLGLEWEYLHPQGDP